MVLTFMAAGCILCSMLNFTSVLHACFIILLLVLLPCPGIADQGVTITGPSEIDAGENITNVDDTASEETYSFWANFYAIEATFNTKDVFLGISKGFAIYTPWKIAGWFFFYGRPYEKTVYDEIAPHNYYQYKEWRFAPGIVIEKIQPLFWYIGIYAGGGVAYSFGFYSGTSDRAESRWTPVGMAGIYIGKLIYLKIGYQYLSIPHTPYNHGYIELCYGF